MNIGLILLVLGIIFVAELPDKSLFAALVLGSKFPALYVWLGAAAAFLIHVIIAVSAGKLLTLLPRQTMEFVIAALFFAGSILLFFGKHSVEDPPPAAKDVPDAVHHPLKVFITAFSVVFIGEWGDITQIATANYAAKYHDPWSVAIGATLGLWLVTALAIKAGSKLLDLIPANVLLRIMGGIMLIFAIISLSSALRH